MVRKSSCYVKKQASTTDRRSRHILPTKKAQVLVDGTYEDYSKSTRTLREKMGGKDFTVILSKPEQANLILLEGKSNG